MWVTKLFVSCGYVILLISMIGSSAVSASAYNQVTKLVYGTDAVRSLPIDILHTDEAIVLLAQVPGASADDVRISVSGEEGVVRLFVNRSRPQLTQDNSLVMNSECAWGEVSRSVILPQSVDDMAVTADICDGVLTVVLPKLSESQFRQYGSDSNI